MDSEREFYVSNILYASIGNGEASSSKNAYDMNGQTDLQNIYNANVEAGYLVLLEIWIGFLIVRNINQETI